ncbi:hypothetical protein QJ850_gp586 [Acanthamoeba polyphaga mimivirus]|uniref:Uncharacterized protein n=1 Tax=Acanthamoeba polyphaga mimivirus Kroon TaxID=3069720 RepID=A0A0G2Y2Y6_9VIRU|nr:hypothetical protein QJ850_gp586 [Acanthamoeba polyphaga mimivirus]AKI80113.1 hypothetical protein [Acanthamoeba polyphaga mimivirus Kroon]
MAKINLRSIFCHLVNDDKFLSVVVEDDHLTTSSKVKKNSNKNKTNIMANMVSEYVTLSPYETQGYALLPHNIKCLLTPDYQRLGINGKMVKHFEPINISFLHSLNILLRPEIYYLNFEEHIKNYSLLEGFLSHMIQRNYQIDKIKNTKKVQAVNKELIKNLSEGKISHDLIQYIVNIFEINLLVFDFAKMDILLYWSKGTKYPYFNLFKDIYCMSYIYGNYEPITCLQNNISEQQKRKMYTYILTNLDNIKTIQQIQLSAPTLLYLSSWDFCVTDIEKIYETFFRNKNSKEILEDVINNSNICN